MDRLIRTHIWNLAIWAYYTYLLGGVWDYNRSLWMKEFVISSSYERIFPIQHVVQNRKQQPVWPHKDMYHFSECFGRFQTIKTNEMNRNFPSYSTIDYVFKAAQKHSQAPCVHKRGSLIVSRPSTHYLAGGRSRRRRRCGRYRYRLPAVREVCLCLCGPHTQTQNSPLEHASERAFARGCLRLV